ncbi:hypothetical protein PLESTB_001705800 [Pleodorina starrii]|uniref:Uncharacterized protein n=1 Tax=Pleodorina starrii TaxID=330485 RepID=A0A9W6C038_9CHLO|nr:hypothetical protein PLESTM_001236300 [Pleodorina starrii]GLC61012.1 hypothetical protein PLESTB_001705800 [Pleodorina starrii]
MERGGAREGAREGIQCGVRCEVGREGARSLRTCSWSDEEEAAGGEAPERGDGYRGGGRVGRVVVVVVDGWMLVWVWVVGAEGVDGQRRLGGGGGGERRWRWWWWWLAAAVGFVGGRAGG